jgi:hypothetical protein
MKFKTFLVHAAPFIMLLPNNITAQTIMIPGTELLTPGAMISAPTQCEPGVFCDLTNDINIMGVIPQRVQAKIENSKIDELLFFFDEKSWGAFSKGLDSLLGTPQHAVLNRGQRTTYKHTKRNVSAIRFDDVKIWQNEAVYLIATTQTYFYLLDRNEVSKVYSFHVTPHFIEAQEHLGSLENLDVLDGFKNLRYGDAFNRSQCVTTTTSRDTIYCDLPPHLYTIKDIRVRRITAAYYFDSLTEITIEVDTFRIQHLMDALKASFGYPTLTWYPYIKDKTVMYRFDEDEMPSFSWVGQDHRILFYGHHQDANTIRVRFSQIHPSGTSRKYFYDFSDFQ